MDKLWFKARRVISVLLVFAMLASLTPVQAFAVDEGTTDVPSETQVVEQEPASTEGGDADGEDGQKTDPPQNETGSEDSVILENNDEGTPTDPAQESGTPTEEPAATPEVVATPEPTAVPTPEATPEVVATPDPTAAPTAEPEKTEEKQAEEAPANEMDAAGLSDEAEPETPATVESVSTQAGSVTATVTATLPAEAALTMTETELTNDQLTAVEKALPENTEIVELQAWDIALTGAELEDKVPVAITGTDLEAGDGYFVAHINSDNTVDTGSYADGVATVSVSSFSPFVVASTKKVEEEPEATPTPTPTSAPLMSFFSQNGLNDAANAPSVLANGQVIQVDVGETITVTGTSSGYTNYWYTQNNNSQDDTKYITVSGSGSSVSVTGNAAGTTKLIHQYRGWSTKTETFTIEVSEAPNTVVTAYFYAVRPDKDPADTGNGSFFYIGDGQLDVSGLSLANGENTTSIGNRVVKGPDEATAKERIAQIYGEDPDDVNISYTYYKIGHVKGAPGFNADNPDASGSDLVEGAFCYHVDMNVDIVTKQKTTYYFYLKDAGSSDFGSAVKQGWVEIGTTVEAPSYPSEKTVNGVKYVFSGWYTDDEFTQKATDFTITANNNRFYASYTPVPEKFTVTWMSQDGQTQLEQDIDVTYGSQPEYNSDEPTKASDAQYDYQFAGWATSADQESGTAAEELPTVDGNEVYYAAFSKTVRSDYTVTWMSQDGQTQLEQDIDVTYGSQPEYNSDEPTKASDAQYDYQFAGWATSADQESGTAAEELPTVDGNEVYYAAFSKTVRSDYTVTWMSQDGQTQLEQDIDVTYGSQPEYNSDEPTKASDAQYDYQFAGWATSADQESGTAAEELPTVDGNEVYYAAFSKTVRSDYTVTWMSQDGQTQLEQDIDVTYGSQPEYNSDEPTKASDAQYDYQFAGWATSADQESGTAAEELPTVDGNEVYYAAFSKTVRSDYTVTWMSQDGQMQLEQDIDVTYGSQPEYNSDEPTKASDAQYDYQFAGWATSADQESGTAAEELPTVDGNEVYYAAFSKTVRSDYTVTWMSQDGQTQLEQDIDVTYGSQPEYNSDEPTKASDAQYDYQFAGWATSADQESGTAAEELPTVDGNEVYYAAFSKTVRSDYTVTWMSQDGQTQLEQDIDVTYGSQPEYNSDEPTKASDAQYDYQFAGWATSADQESGTAAEELPTVDGNEVYYAAFSKTVRSDYTVTWMSQDGQMQLEQDIDVTYGSQPEYNSDEPTKASDAQYDYQFAGWATSADQESGTAAEELPTVDGNEVYYAAFSKTVRSDYTVTWMSQDGQTQLEQDIDVTYGSQPEYNSDEPTKASDAQYDYQFAGWATSADQESGTAAEELPTVDGNEVYYAAFSKTVRSDYTVTWMSQDGQTQLEQDIDVTYGSQPEYNSDEPTKASDAQYDYQFAGWATSADQESGTAAEELPTVDGNEVYYAAFSKTVRSDYTVTWMSQDGQTQLEQDIDVTYGSQPEYNSDEPTKASDAQYDYQFAGWATSADQESGTAAEELPTVDGNEVYYAAFSKTVRSDYTVTWMSQDGQTQLEQDIDVTYGSQPEYNSDEPTKASDAQYDYQFAGWATSADQESGTAAEELPTVDGNEVYYAAFSKTVRSDYTVTWMSQDGQTQLEQDIDVTYGSQPEYNSDEPTKASDAQYDYQFAGWATSADQESGTAAEELPTVDGNEVYYAAFSKTVRQYTYTIQYVYLDRYGQVYGTDKENGAAVDYGTALSELIQLQKQKQYDNKTFIYLEDDAGTRTITENVDANVITIKYDIDDIGKDYNENDPDGTADKDQIVFTYQVNNDKAGTVSKTREVVKKGADDTALAPAAEAKVIKGQPYVFDYWTRSTDQEEDYNAKMKSFAADAYGQDVTFIAHFAEDKKGGGPDGGSGDGVPDYAQIVLTYKSNDESIGTVTIQSETFTFKRAGGHVIEEMTATPGGKNDGKKPAVTLQKPGYVADYWSDGRNAENVVAYGESQPMFEKSYTQDTTFTVFFAEDVKGGGDDGEEPDGIPDKDQVKVTFDVVNGTWTEGGNGQKFAWLVLRDENGNRSENGSAVATMPGTTPINGYSNGVWSPADTKVTKDSVHAFVCTYSIRTDLSYTVRYLEDGTARELNGAKVVGGQTFGATVTESAINIPGYTMTSDKNPQSITIGTGENVITFYYKEIGPDVEPTPTETPTTPTIPTTPTTPTTPAGPTTPTVPATGGPSVTAAPEATQAPAEEEIQEEETPLAPEAGEGEEETIGEGETPLAGGNAAWALLNLILTILTALGSLILLIGYFIGRNRREEEDETTGETRTEYEVNRHGFWRLVSLIPGIGAIIVFILTEDMSLPMVFVDKWTLLMVIIAVIQIVIAVLSMRNREEPDEDDQANA